MNKKLIITAIIMSIFLLNSKSVSAYNYSFSTGADYSQIFDKTTESGDFATINANENLRNNKDTSLAPPPFGVFGGEISTEQISIYYTADKSQIANNSASVIYSDYSAKGVDLPAVSGNASNTILPSTSVVENAKIVPIFYTDGTIGTLEIINFKKKLNVYEGETAENMKLGAAHISSTSVWDGNVCLAAHNRGVENNFSFLKEMKIGDVVKYTTKYGMREYEVIEKRQILVEDTGVLEFSEENILTLITCVENVPELRLAVILAEKK